MERDTLMLSVEFAKAQIGVLREEARLSRGHDGVPTADRVRALLRRPR
jgi:hypothetical protein